MPHRSKTNKSRDLMFKSLAKKAILSSDEEVELSRSYHKSKRKVWAIILRGTKDPERIVRDMIERQPKKSVETIDFTVFERFFQARRAIKISRTALRKEAFRKTSTVAAKKAAELDSCFRCGSSIIEEIESGNIVISGVRYERLIGERDNLLRARNEFIERNMRLVISMTKRYRGFGLPHEDLIQEGVFGLQKAVDLFDPEKGFKFSTYSSWWIRASVQRFCRDKSRTIRIPVHMQEARERYASSDINLDELSVEDAAEAIGISEKKVNIVRGLRRCDCISLDIRIGDERDDATMVDFLVADGREMQYSEASLDMERVMEVMVDLPERERYILEARFGLGDCDEKTLQEIADEYGMSRERVRQLQVKAMRSLKKRIERRAMGIRAGLR